MATARIDALVPDTVTVVIAVPGDEQRPLFPAEEALIARAVASRRAEFRAGRASAREALRRLGLPDRELLADERRAPRWPDGVVGSITHGAGLTAVAAALRTDIAMLGIDAERAGRLDDDDGELVIGPGERRRASDELGEDAGLLLFSAKESIYKAWYPATGRWLDFTDVIVSIDSAGTFTVEPQQHLARGDRAVLAALQGRFTISGDVIATAVHTPA